MKTTKKTVPLTANNLTLGIKNYIKILGGHAVRINTMGVWDAEKNAYRKVAKDDKGISDIIATIQGQAIFIEIKIGNDKQSQAQIEFQKNIEQAGGIYIIAKDLLRSMAELELKLREKEIIINEEKCR